MICGAPEQPGTGVCSGAVQKSGVGARYTVCRSVPERLIGRSARKGLRGISNDLAGSNPAVPGWAALTGCARLPRSSADAAWLLSTLQCDRVLRPRCACMALLIRRGAGPRGVTLGGIEPRESWFNIVYPSSPERLKDLADFSAKSLNHMVGAAGFELATLCSQSRCATRLRYAPKTSTVTESGVRLSLRAQFFANLLGFL